MRTAILSSVALTVFSAGVAMADPNERLIACYRQEVVPAQYNVKKVLIQKPVRKYLKRNGRIELVEYPAIYREDKTLLKAAHKVMKEIPCK